MFPVHVETVRLFLHVLAATIWVGGQLTLGALVPVLRRAGTDVPRMAARQFGRLAWTAYAVLVATGIWNVADYHAKDADGYDGTLAAKLTFVVLSGVSAYVHQRATSRLWLAIGGAAAALFSLLALFYGVLLAG
jgi:putative copper export protein